MKLNLSQQIAVRRVRRHLEEQLKPGRYGETLTEWSFRATDYGTIWIYAQIEMLGLPQGNLLRALDHSFWSFSIGKRGAITMHAGPRAYKQFAGKGRTSWGFTVKA